MSAKYQAYAEYKDSGVEWLGKIPSQWSTSKFTNYIEIRHGFQFRDYDFTDEGIKIIKITQLDKRGHIELSKCSNISASRLSEFPNIQIKEKDILMCLTGGTIGKIVRVGKVDEPLLQNYRVGHFSSSSSLIIDDYVYYLMSSSAILDQINFLLRETGQPNIGMDDFGQMKICVPELDTQKEISSFLDHETAKIDTLIEKQQQLIKLLKEKRQAVISHAVTKGLNPNVPMRDSGVEWLGEVPEHWVVKRLRYIGACQNGINIGAEFFGSGYPFVSYGDAYKNEVLPKHVNGLVQSSGLDRKTYSVLIGDVIFTRTSETIDEIGLSSTCLATIEDASFAGFLIRFRPKSNMIDAGFSKYYFRNSLLRAFFIKEMNLVTRASLSQDLLKKLPVMLPPLEEQKRIAKFLDKKASIFSKLIVNSETAIELSKERRTALISAAVTGKIDRRNWEALNKENKGVKL